MKKLSTRQITLAAAVGAIYVVLGYFGNIFGLTFGPIQCRFAEALTVLPFLYPSCVWGLFIGCILSNLLSPYGLLDLIFGSMATLFAGLLTARCGKRALAPLPPVICNGLLVGLLVTVQEVSYGAGFWKVFCYNALTVAAGELIACAALGIPLLLFLEKKQLFQKK